MSASPAPSSPDRELAARRGWTGPTLANGTLTPDLAAFCQSGVSVVLGSASFGRPVVGRGVGCRIDAAGQVRVLVRRPANAALLAAVAGGAALAVTFTEPSTHRSIQLKAAGAAIAEPEAPDASAAARQAAHLAAELRTDGYSELVADAYCSFDTAELVALDFVPTDAFVQTPGPSAGTALTP